MAMHGRVALLLFVPSHRALDRYHGHALFRAFITATNEVGEIRIQFHVVTDGHDQFDSSIWND